MKNWAYLESALYDRSGFLGTPPEKLRGNKRTHEREFEIHIIK